MLCSEHDLLLFNIYPGGDAEGDDAARSGVADIEVHNDGEGGVINDLFENGIIFLKILLIRRLADEDAADHIKEAVGFEICEEAAELLRGSLLLTGLEEENFALPVTQGREELIL